MPETQYCLVDAKAEDFSFVYELKKIAYKEYVQQTWGWDDDFQTKFHKESFSAGNTKIIMAGEKPVGSVDVKEGTSNIFISGLYLFPAYQSKGIGTKIINTLLSEAAVKNKRLELEVLRVNVRAQKLYERLGFTKAERDKNKYFMYKEPETTKEKTVNEITIIDYKEQFAADFADLNKAWLQKYFVVEPIDEEIFANPKKYIIDNGGCIFFALVNNKVAGTFALMKVEEGVFELSKMAVAEEHQGKSIGNKMIEFSIGKAREMSAKKIILYSNTLLQPAIHLYKKYDFKEVPLDAVEYKRANIKMEYDFKLIR